MPTYFTPIPESPNQLADADTFNDPMLELDAGIGVAWARGDDALSIATANNSELVAARSSYASLDARLDVIENITVVAGGNVVTTANGAASAGQKTVTVVSTAGFVAGASVEYLLNGTTLEYNTVDVVTDSTHLLLDNNIGTGGILSGGLVSLISTGIPIAANAIHHGSTDLTLSQTIDILGDNAFRADAYPSLTDLFAAVASAGGGVVIFGAGTTYTPDALASGVTIPSNTKIIGNGAKIHVDLAVTDTGSYQAFYIADGSHDIEISGLEFYGNNSPFDDLHANIEQNVISAPGVGGTLTKDVWIHHCTFRNVWGFPVHNAGTGERINVTDCTFRECGNGINVNSDYTIQARNQLYKCEGFETSGAYAVIVDNIIVSASNAISLGGRTASGADTPGIRCANNVIVDTVSGPGISLNDSCQDTVIDGNIIIRSYTQAISIVAGAYNKILNTRISNNVIRSPGNDGTALGNRIGIYAAPTENANDIDGLVIAGNYIYANAEDTSHSPAFGIAIGACTRVDISENTILGMSDKDISCDTTELLSLGRNRCDPAKVEFIDSCTFVSTLASVWSTLTATKTWTPASTADGATETTTIDCVGCAIGDTVLIDLGSANTGVFATAHSYTDVVRVNIFNKSGGAWNPGSITTRVTVLKVNQ